MPFTLNYDYENDILYKMGVEEGERKGFRIGQEIALRKGIIRTVKKLYTSGKSVEEIMDTLKLSKEAVMTLLVRE